MEGNASVPDATDALLQDLFDPGLSREQFRTLEQLLERSRSARKRYIRYVALHSMLELELQWRGERRSTSSGNCFPPANRGCRMRGFFPRSPMTKLRRRIRLLQRASLPPPPHRPGRHRHHL